MTETGSWRDRLACGPDGVEFAAAMSSAEELGDTVRRIVPDLTEAEALEAGVEVRRIAMDVVIEALAADDERRGFTYDD